MDLSVQWHRHHAIGTLATDESANDIRRQHASTYPQGGIGNGALLVVRTRSLVRTPFAERQQSVSLSGGLGSDGRTPLRFRSANAVCGFGNKPFTCRQHRLVELVNTAIASFSSALLAKTMPDRSTGGSVQHRLWTPVMASPLFRRCGTRE